LPKYFAGRSTLSDHPNDFVQLLRFGLCHVRADAGHDGIEFCMLAGFELKRIADDPVNFTINFDGLSDVLNGSNIQ
jgi:hypothetical protein